MDTKLRLLLWFLLMCGWTFQLAQGLKKNTKKRIKSGISFGVELTSAIISLLSDPSSIKNMKWKQIGELLQDLAESIYGVENELEEFGDDLEDLQEKAESNTVAYLSGLPILAIVFWPFCAILEKLRPKLMNLGTNLEHIRHQVQTFFKIRNLEVPQDIERDFSKTPRHGKPAWNPIYAKDVPESSKFARLCSCGHPNSTKPPASSGAPSSQ